MEGLLDSSCLMIPPFACWFLMQEAPGAVKSRWNLAWLLLLVLKAFGLKEGDPVAFMGLQCFCTLPSYVMNCSWSAPDVNATYVLFYRSHKFRPDETQHAQTQRGQNWLVVARSRLMLGEVYSVWLEAHRPAGRKESEKLRFSLDEIVKPPVPELEPVVVSSSGAMVRWENPYWSEHFADQPLVCELRYKTAKGAVWTLLGVDQVCQEGHELEDLDSFTRYQVEARCIPEHEQGSWSDWSSPQTFRTLEAAPRGQVDVWRNVHLAANLEPRLHLLWKALDPEAARGDILNYTVDFWDRRKTVVASLVCVCCSVPVPAAASYAQVSACSSAGKTQPAGLSLEQTDLPGPQGVRVLAVERLGLNVTWEFSPSPGGAQPEQYVVEWREEVSEELVSWIRRPVGSTGALLRGGFRREKPYLVSVHAVYAQGSNSSAPVRAYAQEGAPSVGPRAVQSRSLSSTVSLILWEEIPLADRHGHLTHYTIYLQPSTSRNPKAYRTGGAGGRSYRLAGLEPGSSYQLWMTGSTSAGEGGASPVLVLHTPGTRWQVYLAALLSAGSLLILAVVVVFLKRGWFLSVCRKVLPLWCWERVPDPGHSLVILKMDPQSAALAKDASSQPHPAKPPDEPEILTITEPAPPQATSPTQVTFSDYEKHFLPTQEELQRLT